MTDLTNRWAYFGKLIADECNVKRVVINGVTIYEEPLLKDKYPEKYRQCEEIYNEYRDDK